MRRRLRPTASALAGAAILLALLSCATHTPPRTLVDHASTTRSASPTPSPTPTPEIVVHEVSETSPVPFASASQNDPNLPQGQTRIVTAGAAGVMTTTYRVETTDGVETSRVQVSQSITTQPVTQITALGTYVPPPPPPPPAATTHGTVIPGGFCSPSDQGVTATAANGRSYTCGGKGPDASGHLHWNV